MRFLLSIAACLAAAYALAAFIAIPANPEVRFWNHVDELRDQEIAQVRKDQPGKPILFFTGGSSCAFSIDPKIVEETCGMPAFNLGLPVSAGPKYLLHQALIKCQPGDILVVALEPDALVYHSRFAASPFSFGLSVLNRRPSDTVGGSTFSERLTFREFLNYSRPGPSYVSILIAKTITGKGYRYQVDDIRYRGRIETPIKMSPPDFAETKYTSKICDSGKELLQSLASAASANGVHVIYSVPWTLTAPSSIQTNRSANSKILESINQVIPTVEDGYLGVTDDPDFFADSGLHLSAEGSKLRSQALSIVLKNALVNLNLKK